MGGSTRAIPAPIADSPNPTNVPKRPLCMVNCYHDTIRPEVVALLKMAQSHRLTKEHTMNYVPPSFREDIMFRAVVEEAAALASITLFLGMIAVWAQVISAM